MRGSQLKSHMPGLLVIRRDSSTDIKVRDLYLHVDDAEEHNLLYGKSLELPLPPGEHTLAITNRLYTKRETFQLGDNETVTFQAANTVSGCASIVFVAVGMGPYRVELSRQQ